MTTTMGKTKATDGTKRVKRQKATAAHLARLAEQFQEAHHAAERAQYDALQHARDAGRVLNEAKRLVPYGEWLTWLEQQGIPPATASLYAKVDREWHRLTESQRVGNLTLRQAADLLYGDDGEVPPEPGEPPRPLDYGDLATAGLLGPSDLDGLAPIQARALVTEVRAAYAECCLEEREQRIAGLRASADLADHAEAERLTVATQTTRVLVDRAWFRTVVPDVAQQLRAGTIPHRRIGALVHPARRPAHTPLPPGPGSRTVLRVPSLGSPVTELADYRELVMWFVTETERVLAGQTAIRLRDIDTGTTLRTAREWAQGAVAALTEWLDGGRADL